MALLGLTSLVGAAVTVAVVVREPDPHRVELRLDSPAPGTFVTTVGESIPIRGALAGAYGCELQWGEHSIRVERGEFGLSVPAPDIGRHMVWLRGHCDGVAAPSFARDIVVTGGEAVEAVPVARFSARTDPLLAPASEFALEHANEALRRYLAEEVRGAEIIAIDVPVGRIGASIQGWAAERLGDDAAERFDDWIPDRDVALEMRWGDATNVHLDNLRLTVGDGAVRARFDIDLSIALDVRAAEEERASRDWSPPPLELSLARLSVRFDVSEWPRVAVTHVDLVGDLCERPNGRFWRRRCAELIPRIGDLVERPVRRALQERVDAWSAESPLESIVLSAVAPGDAWAALVADAGTTVILREVSEERVAIEAHASSEWLGSTSGLSAEPAEMGHDLELSVSTTLFSTGLGRLFDRPLAEVPDALAHRTAELAPGRVEALDRVMADLEGDGRLTGGAWDQTLALTNLALARDVRMAPFVPDADDSLRLAFEGVPTFRGIDVPDVHLLVSASLPIAIEPTPTAFVLRPDVASLLGNLALEARGPDSTTRDDARRFAAFLQQELARNFGDDPEEPLVDLRGVVDAFELVPTIPRAMSGGGVAVEIETLRYDPELRALVAGGSGRLVPPVDND